MKFKSIELIKHSEFVLAHASTALSMAVIYKKPIIFLSSRSYHSTYIRAIKFSAEALAGIIIDLSLNNYILPDSLEINNIAYDDFIEYYLNYKNPNNIPLVKLIQDYYTSF